MTKKETSNELQLNRVENGQGQKLSFIKYLHEHLGKTQFHDQYHVGNQDHPSTEELEQECLGHDLKRQADVNISAHLQMGQIYKHTLKKMLILTVTKNDK